MILVFILCAIFCAIGSLFLYVRHINSVERAKETKRQHDETVFNNYMNVKVGDEYYTMFPKRKLDYRMEYGEIDNKIRIDDNYWDAEIGDGVVTYTNILHHGHQITNPIYMLPYKTTVTELLNQYRHIE